MRARARLATEREPSSDGQARTRLDALRSDWPLMLRPTLPLEADTITTWSTRDAAAARVHLTSGAAGPVGGDQLRLDVHVGPGSTLILGEVSPTLLLPGPHGEESRTEIDIRVQAGGTLAWLPQLVIAAHGCRHRSDIHITLEPEARLLLREQTLFGRHGEPPGTLRQRLRVVLDQYPLYDQELSTGPTAAGWDSPAVTAGNRTVGSLLVVDTAGHTTLQDSPRRPDTAALTLTGPAILISTLAADTATLRRNLDTALTHLCSGDPNAQY